MLPCFEQPINSYQSVNENTSISDLVGSESSFLNNSAFDQLHWHQIETFRTTVLKHPCISHPRAPLSIWITAIAKRKYYFLAMNTSSLIVAFNANEVIFLHTQIEECCLFYTKITN